MHTIAILALRRSFRAGDAVSAAEMIREIFFNSGCHQQRTEALLGNSHRSLREQHSCGSVVGQPDVRRLTRAR